MLKLKLQYFGHLMQRTDSLEKILMLGKLKGGRRGQQRMEWLDGTTDSMDMSLGGTPGVGDGQRGLVCCSPWDCQESDTTERLNWANRYLYHWGFPGDASGKEHACQCRRRKRHGFNPWVGKIPWRRHGNPLQYSCLGNTINRGAWQATVHRVAESQTQLKQFTMHAFLII